MKIIGVLALAAAVSTAAPARAEKVAVVEDLNQFAFELQGQLRGVPGNLIYSPAGVAMALDTLLEGARGETRLQIRSVLHLGPDDKVPGFAAYDEPGGLVTLSAPAKVFVDQAVRLAQGTDAENVDLAGDPEAARAHMNHWAAGQTNQRVKDALPAGSVDRSTRMVLVNAMYFLGKWANPFIAAKTTMGRWRGPEGVRTVPTMHKLDTFAYARARGATLVDLPYGTGDIVMTIVLPDKVDGVARVEQGLDAKIFASWVAGMKPTMLELSLPRFKIEPGAPLALAPVLKALGMPLAFDPAHADFKGISPEPLAVGQMFHAAYVSVDEEGTEAAAVTATTMVPLALHVGRARPVAFHADHPFLFYVRVKSSGLILFSGRLASA